MLIRPAYVTSTYGVGAGVWACIIAVAGGKTTDLPLLREPMQGASDYIHPTPRGGRCRIRIYLPEEVQHAPVVICSELPNIGGTAVTYATEQLAAEVIRS